MSRPLNLPPEHPTILSFSGPDTTRFLNGQITQDVTSLGEQALPACVTDAKGRLQFFIKVFAGPDSGSIWITCPADQSDGLRDRLEHYLIADDVEVDDLTTQWASIHSEQRIENSSFTRASRGHFGEGYDCWWSAEELPAIGAIDRDHAEALRIAARIPAWGKELGEGMLPPDAGLDGTSISYHKGCYIGQEVLSRIKAAGRLNRRLAAFEVTGSPDEGDLLFLDSKEVGQVTSCRGPSALGFLKKQGFMAREFTIIDEAGNTTGTAAFLDWA